MATQPNNNQLNLNDIYNLNRCNGNNCDISDTTRRERIVKSSLETIASYNDDIKRPNMLPINGFNNSSPEQGNIEQMYQPITQSQADKYPTPAIVAEENNNSTTTDSEEIIDGITDYANPYPVTRESIRYLNGFIRTQIGRRVSIDFLIGSNTIETKSGYLLAVAANYILINELDTNDVTACDFYNIKFIRFYY